MPTHMPTSTIPSTACSSSKRASAFIMKCCQKTEEPTNGLVSMFSPSVFDFAAFLTWDSIWEYCVPSCRGTFAMQWEVRAEKKHQGTQNEINRLQFSMSCTHTSEIRRQWWRQQRWKSRKKKLKNDGARGGRIYCNLVGFFLISISIVVIRHSSGLSLMWCALTMYAIEISVYSIKIVTNAKINKHRCESYCATNGL